MATTEDGPDLRSRHAAAARERTRRQIIEGLVEALGHGLGSVSMRTVAQHAGVSVPTVYRYFSNVDEMLQALPAYVRERVDVVDASITTPEELADRYALFASRVEDFGAALFVALASEEGAPARQEYWREGMEHLERVLAGARESLSADEFRRLCAAVACFGMPFTAHFLRHVLQFGPEEAALTIREAVAGLVAAANREAG